jgi:hypothetical protein
MRWKAELPKMPRLPRVPLEAGKSAAFSPPPAPSVYREKNPPEPPPADFKARSMLAEHRGLALLFLAAVIAFAWYCWEAPSGKAPHRSIALDAPAQAAQAAQASGAGENARTHGPEATGSPEASQSPIYVETLPDKER